jgi:thiamine-phosphate pyrophosphorylase
VAGVRSRVKGWSVYVVTDATLSRGRSHLEVARGAIAGGADVVQLRDKEAPGRALYEIAGEIGKLAQDAGVPFLVNDRVDIAVAAGADGVHVGREDLPPIEARRLVGPDRILGVSASSVEEALDAERDGADYVGFGPVFEARGTKPDADPPTGLERLRDVCERCVVPVIAIGGIRHGNVDQVIAAGVAGVAVISGVVGAPDIAATVRDLKDRIHAAREGAERLRSLARGEG